jgi:hypothetical protein
MCGVVHKISQHVWDPQNARNCIGVINNDYQKIHQFALFEWRDEDRDWLDEDWDFFGLFEFLFIVFLWLMEDEDVAVNNI